MESWNAADHPDQRRLSAYLDEIEALIGAYVPTTSDHLTLELTVGLPASTALTSGGRDLDNYLLPIARRVGHRRLDAVFGRKQHADASTIAVGLPAQESSSPGEPQLQLRTTGSTESPAWKQRIHGACSAVIGTPLPQGSVALCIRFGVSSARNWSTLWKPTIDALGPLLGTQNPLKPFRPSDDRIVDLALHRTIDDALGNDVGIDIWWQQPIS
ncbi:hypothetical protein [Actinoallomurus oryzae]|uniref:hypothetical protein n=1 Tax=Actinoallomurus oryzae TaxID=502180 RepID=UPI0031E9DFF6